jgi:hypothetical protein
MRQSLDPRRRAKVVRTVAVAVVPAAVDVRIASRPAAAVAAVAPIVVATTNVAVADVAATAVTLGKMISPDDKDSSKEQLNNNIKKVPPVKIEMQAGSFSTSTSTTITTDAEIDELVTAEIDELLSAMQE